MRKFVILHPSGSIARTVINRVLNEEQFNDVNLTLLTDMPDKVQEFSNNPRVEIINGDNKVYEDVQKATQGADIVFLGKVDDYKFNPITNHLIRASKQNKFNRIIELSLAGLYYEIEGEFGNWVDESVGSGRFIPAREAGQLLEKSNLNFTLIRMPALTNWPDIKYSLTQRNDVFEGVSVSRKSVADLVVKILADPSYCAYSSVGISQPETAGYTRPVY